MGTVGSGQGSLPGDLWAHMGNVLRSQDHIHLANYLSSRHPNIKFTYEMEVNNTLPFLDVNVYRESNKFSSTVQRLFLVSTRTSVHLCQLLTREV